MLIVQLIKTARDVIMRITNKSGVFYKAVIKLDSEEIVDDVEWADEEAGEVMLVRTAPGAHGARRKRELRKGKVQIEML